MPDGYCLKTPQLGLIPETHEWTVKDCQKITLEFVDRVEHRKRGWKWMKSHGFSIVPVRIVEVPDA